MSNNLTKTETTSQKLYVLQDGENDWKGKKELALLLAESFLRLSNKPFSYLAKYGFGNENLYNKYLRMNDCSSYLEFRVTTDEQLKLVNANFCRIRLCPMCTWRRTKKIFAQVSKIIQEINKEKEREYIFLTLTCKNVSGENLKQEIKNILKAFKTMFDKNKRVKKICLGYFRGLEVTRNDNGTYHPHIHCIICVNKSYFTSRDYIKQKEWASIWQKYLKLDYIPIVHVEKATNSYKSVAELSKYSVKVKDIFLQSEEETDNNVLIIHSALHRVRLVGMGGLFKEYHKKLNLEDAEGENADLVSIDGQTDDQILTDIVLRFGWNLGYRNYILQRKEVEENE